MYDVIFYRDKNGNSEIKDYLMDLMESAETSKDHRLNLQKIFAYIDMLKEKGLSLREPYIKYIQDGIWELRPLKNRILFFYWNEKKFILLRHFMKDKRKTPQREIRIALRMKKDYQKRNGEHN